MMVLRAMRGGTGSKYATLRGGRRQAIPVPPREQVLGVLDGTVPARSGSSRGPSPPTWRANRSFGRQVSRRRCRLPLPAPLPVFLEEDKGPDDDVLPASRIPGRGRVDTGCVERPARNRAVGHRVIAFEHRDLGRLLLGEPVPLVVGTVAKREDYASGSHHPAISIRASSGSRGSKRSFSTSNVFPTISRLP